jgi:16S rRNA (uracil1498-N3)-methyltransferase
MRLPRLFVDQELISESQLNLAGQQAHYLSKVLRLKANTELIIFNGRGSEFAARLLQIGKQQVSLVIGAKISVSRESPLRTLLGLGLSRGERMDYAIQKSTELGVTLIAPLFTEYSEVKLQGERLQKKLQHWQQISISACEQSGRTQLPILLEPQPLAQWCQAQTSPIKLIFNPQDTRAAALPDRTDEVALLLGPEGGFSLSELSLAKTAGFQPVQLGTRILRTETAPVAALSMLQLKWGDFSF